MTKTLYFDAYMRGERSRDYKLKAAGVDPILIDSSIRSMPIQNLLESVFGNVNYDILNTDLSF